MEGWQFAPAQELRRTFILDETRLGPIHWYHRGRSAAVVMSVDDVFPGTSRSAYEAGGDLDQGALGRLLWLLQRHPQLWLTLFVTPDWRRISPLPDRICRHVPGLRDWMYLSKVLPKGTMDVRKHPDFVAFLNAMPRTEVALHGLSHVNSGPSISLEFQDRDRETCAGMLAEALQIFDEAGLRYLRGLQPPGWNCSPALQQACRDVGIEWIYVCAGRPNASFEGLDDGDVRIDWREHAVSGANCRALAAHQHQLSGNIAAGAGLRDSRCRRRPVDQGPYHQECRRAYPSRRGRRALHELSRPLAGRHRRPLRRGDRLDDLGPARSVTVIVPFGIRMREAGCSTRRLSGRISEDSAEGQ